MAVQPQVRVEREALALRIVWMLLFAIGWQVAELVLFGLVLVQLVYRLIKGQLHQKLQSFAAGLSVFIGQVAAYLTFASEEKPWPFAPWPQAEEVAPEEDAPK